MAAPIHESKAAEEAVNPLTGSQPTGLKGRWQVAGVCVILAGMVWWVFGQTLHYEFVNNDDDTYVYKNLVVEKGLTWEGVSWALTYGNIGHWHPLTWVSHMLDSQVYGLNAGGHHLTNVVLHAATAVLLFLVLWRMTGKLWRSAFVGAVFAIHPLRVESVAWVAERKDVLSAFFFMLTLGAYVRYVRRPFSMVGYGAVVLLYAMGLLSKNMLVTLPFVLLLLDYWPLKRFQNFTAQAWLWLVAEKIPLLVLTVGSCVATALVPEKVAAVYSLSFGLRLENAVVSYVIYLWQMLYPAGLACLYPNPTTYLPLWQVAGALGLLLAITGAVWAVRRTRPYLAVGWLWYVGMLVPVIGLVQISYYAHADRYTYLPQIGLYLVLTWAVAELGAGWRYRQLVLGGVGAVLLVAMMISAREQTGYWRDSETLWRHTLACTSNNYVAHNNFGGALNEKGRIDEAMMQFQMALQVNPDIAETHHNLATALLQKGRMDEAMVQYQRALQLEPDDVEAHNNLGNALQQKGGMDEAIIQYKTALQLKPDYVEAHYNLGNALRQKGEVDEAMVQYQTALQLKPDFAEACNSLGYALILKGEVDEAMVKFEAALQMKPDYTEAYNNLGNALLQKGRMDEAIIQYQRALQLKPDNVEAHNNLGNALQQKGEVDEAIAQYQTALQLKPGNTEVRCRLGKALLQKGRVAEAMVQYQTALQIQPDSVEALNNLAWLLATCLDARIRDGVQAVANAERACKLTDYKQTLMVGTLAAAYAEAGRYDDAIAAAKKACALATAAGEPGLLKKNQELLVLYRAHQPYHEAAGSSVPAARE